MEAREAMAMASFQAGVAFGRTSVGYAHAVAHQLGRICGTPHGEANAMVLPEVLEAYGDVVVEALTALAKRVAPEGTDADHRWLISRVRELRADLGLPLKPGGLESAHLDEAVRLARREAGEFYPVPRYLDEATLRGIVASLL
jgi:alcohol dehydrogenase class IV